jgi:hypothetical protein
MTPVAAAKEPLRKIQCCSVAHIVISERARTSQLFAGVDQTDVFNMNACHTRSLLDEIICGCI